MKDWKFRGQDMLNFHAYFDTDYSYTEEFDTPDGKHWIARTKVDDWTPDILKLAIDSGVIQEDSIVASDPKSSL